MRSKQWRFHEQWGLDEEEGSLSCKRGHKGCVVLCVEGS